MSRAQARAWRVPGNMLPAGSPSAGPDFKVIDAVRACIDPTQGPEWFLAVQETAGQRGGVLFGATDSNGSFRRRGGVLRRDYFPFRVRVGDLDNDGETELVAGVRDPLLGGWRQHKLHVYKLLRGRLIPAWFSGRVYEDFQVGQLGDKMRLIEIRRGHSVWSVNVFTWNGFGLWLDETILSDAKGLRFVPDSARILVRRTDGLIVEVYWNGQQIETRLP